MQIAEDAGIPCAPQGPLSFRPPARRTNTRPISLLGGIGAGGLFHLRAEFPKNLARFAWTTPAIPTAWLEWEVKPLGLAFDGTGIQQGTPRSLVPAGGMLTFVEPVLASVGGTPLRRLALTLP